MILFVAPNPTKVKEREGFLQRVAAIDELFIGEEKIYLEDLKEPASISKELGRADMIYVHSIYQSEKIIASYPLLSDKIVTDIHGAVPEEVEYLGDTERASRLAEVENEVFKNSSRFVAVSQAMVDYYNKKYKTAKSAKWVILPIFNIKNPTRHLDKKPIVVYAGGAQRWQNLDLMVKAINKTYKKYSFNIITHSPGAFNRISEEASLKTTIQTIPSVEVEKQYEDASLGFVLRDDIIMNNVACPTKLIEYLANGVVPVVLSPNIGDFKTHGYSYVNIDEFEQKNLSPERLRKAAERNVEIFKQIDKKSKVGEERLKEMYAKMKQKTKSTKLDFRLHAKIFEQGVRIRELERDVEEYKSRLLHEHQIKEHYQRKYNEVIYSKRWRFMAKILRLPAITKGVTKRNSK